jgi:diguanylate cyclase (GGDEF)-like protein
MRVAQAGIIERQTAELRSANEQLAKVAHEDVLTGIFNRRGFLAIADGLWHRTRRGGEHLSVLMFDIDHFKRTNDTYGHAAGDAVLKAVAERTNCMLRPADVFARYGGEEFIVLLNGTDGDRAAAIANRIRNAFATEAVIHEDRAIGLRASFGVAEAGPDDPDLKAVIDRADAALYRAKAEGRNRVEKG